MNTHTEKAFDDLEKNTIEARVENRNLWDKLISTTLGILGFSLTLFATGFLSSKIIDSSSKYFLLSSWILYCLSLFFGFLLLKRESSFNNQEYFRKSLYALDISKMKDDNLAIKAEMKEKFTALQVLHSKRNPDSNFWTNYAKDIYKKNKRELDSYKLIKNPEKFYSCSYKNWNNRCEKTFYLTIILATLFLITSVVLVLL